MAFAYLTLTENEDEIRSMLHESVAGMWSSAEIRRWYNLGCWKTAELLKCCKTEFDYDSVVGQSPYVLEKSFIDLKEVTYNGQPLTKINHAQKQIIFGSSTPTSASSTHYLPWGKTINLYPAPDTKDIPILVYAYELPDFASGDTAVNRLIELCPQLWELPILFALSRAEYKDKNSVRQTGNLKLFYDACNAAKRSLPTDEDYIDMAPAEYLDNNYKPSYF